MLEAAGLGLSAGGRELVRALDFSLAPGQFWGLLGRNGAGKTSLILALAGLRAPQSGAVALDGVPLAAVPRRELARRVAVLLQDENSDFWGSVLDYVMLGRYPRSRSASSMRFWGRDEEGLRGARRRLAELDLADREAQAYRTLSGGERQRARVAQLLLQDADILLLDEPLQHLDLRHQAVVMGALAACAADGKAVLTALHEPGHAARHCTFSVLLYDAGRASLGRSSDMLTQANLEALYQCALEAAGARSFLPS
jgi:iron complex transport system ATP-binding protein